MTAWDDVETAAKFVRNAGVPKLAGIIAYRRKQLDVARAKFEESYKIGRDDCETGFYLGCVVGGVTTQIFIAAKMLEYGEVTEELPDVLLRMISGRCEAESCAPETAMLLRPPGAYARAAPAEELCRGDAPTPACRAAIAKVDGMRRVYQHLLRQSHLPVEGARIAETGAH